MSDERTRLLFGPYETPSLKKGARATCLYRDCLVVVTSWSAARTSWPLCRPVGAKHGRPTLLVEDELARAIQNESAAALRHHWGVGTKQVAAWRKCFGIGRAGTPGSKRLIDAASEAGAAVLRGAELPPEQCERRRRTALEKGFAERLEPGYQGPWWTAEELALLGTTPDEEVAQRVGRSVEAVRLMRTRRGVATALDRRRRHDPGPPARP
jgi:hypothetical protein